MFVDRGNTGGETTAQERREGVQADHRVLGHVVQCDGARAVIAAQADNDDGSAKALWSVGKMVSINLQSTYGANDGPNYISGNAFWQGGRLRAIGAGVASLNCDARDHPGRRGSGGTTVPSRNRNR